MVDFAASTAAAAAAGLGLGADTAAAAPPIAAAAPLVLQGDVLISVRTGEREAKNRGERKKSSSFFFTRPRFMGTQLCTEIVLRKNEGKMKEGGKNCSYRVTETRAAYPPLYFLNAENDQLFFLPF